MKLKNVSESYKFKIELSQMPSEINNMDYEDVVADQFFAKFSQNSSCDVTISDSATYFDARRRNSENGVDERMQMFERFC